MADEYFIEQILKEAKKQGLLKGKQNPCVLETINSANDIIKLLKEESSPLSTEQIANHVGLDINTVRIYLRVLNKLQIIIYTKKKTTKFHHLAMENINLNSSDNNK